MTLVIVVPLAVVVAGTVLFWAPFPWDLFRAGGVRALHAALTDEPVPAPEFLPAPPLMARGTPCWEPAVIAPTAGTVPVWWDDEPPEPLLWRTGEWKVTP